MTSKKNCNAKHKNVSPKNGKSTSRAETPTGDSIKWEVREKEEFQPTIEKRGNESVFTGAVDYDCKGCGEPLEEDDPVETHDLNPEGDQRYTHEVITHKSCAKKYQMLKGLDR